MLDIIKIKYTLQSICQEYLKKKMQNKRKYLLNTYLVKDCYPKYTKNS